MLAAIKPDILTPEQIRERLESAGKTLMMLPMPKNGMPMGAISHWPQTVRSYAEFFAAQILADEDNKLELMAGRNAVRIRPQQRQIDDLEEVLGWLFLIQDGPKRRVVTMRSLKHPISEKHLYSWRKIATEFRLNEKTVRNWHADGIEEIRKGLC